MSIRQGDTFILAEDGHLWMVIAGPTDACRDCVLANLTTDFSRAGGDCELNRGDHPWITKKCYVSFGDARRATPEQQAKMLAFIDSGTIKRHSPLGETILRTIRAAAKAADSLPAELRPFFQ